MIGDGSYQFMVVDQGGAPARFSIDGIISATIVRVRDDISTLSMRVVSPSAACCEKLADTRTIRYEIVVLRDGVRVFEGPITRISYGEDDIELDAACVVWYLSRRALEVDVDYTGISANAIDVLYYTLRAHYPDPDRFKIGKFITKINSSDDARTAAKHPKYSKTLFEFLDKYAEDGGVDYTVIGRQIVIYDVHCKAHVLNKLGDKDFNNSLRVVEYGSQLRTRSISTRNDGVAAVVPSEPKWLDYYGVIDHVVSNTNEESPDESISNEVLTSQAQHNLLSGYPSPVDILVPANAMLMPCTPIEYEQLIPGGWLVVESGLTCRKVAQWMRLDEVRTTIGEEGEQVFVSIGQAPTKSVSPL